MVSRLVSTTSSCRRYFLVLARWHLPPSERQIPLRDRSVGGKCNYVYVRYMYIIISTCIHLLGYMYMPYSVRITSLSDFTSLYLFCHYLSLLVINSMLTNSFIVTYSLVKFTANSDAKKAVKMFNGFVTGGDELPLVVRFDRK